MILNLFISIVITIIWHAMQVITCCSTNIPSKDLELKEAVKLKTGFAYPRFHEFQKLNFYTIKKKLLKIESLPNENKFENTIDIIYCDLVCGNMYLLYNYLSICRDVKKCHLSEKVTSHMLASILKINKRHYAFPIWQVHMYLLHTSMCLRNSIDMENNSLIKDDIKITLEIYINNKCRKNNSYSMTGNPDNRGLQDIEIMINYIQQHNDSILLENDKEKNWVSLKSIYLYKIKDKNILREIIMNFGDQSEEVFNKIYEELDESYNIAENYYYLDLWIINVKEYQVKMLNVIRTVTLHIIRKHMIYASKYWKLKSTVYENVNAEMNDMNEYILDNDFFRILFSLDLREMIEVLRNSTKKPKVENGVNLTLNKSISDIERFMTKFSPIFGLINFNDKPDNEHSDKIREELMQNTENIESYLEYLESLFDEYNINTYETYSHQYVLKEGVHRQNKKILIDFNF